VVLDRLTKSYVRYDLDVLRVTVLELPARWGDAPGAVAALDSLLEKGPATDLVVVPELAFTGYASPELDFDVTRFAESIDGPTARETAAVAKRHGIHLLAPVVLRDGDHLYNACILHGPGGVLATYRKRHPWIPERWARRGAEPPPIVEIAGKRVTISFCYDVHFFRIDTWRQLRAADLLLFPSAWVDAHDTRIPTLTAVARRFDVAVASANWGPGVVAVRGQGDSCVIDRKGEILARVERGAIRADATIT
jgi:predicted amidohydrolase